MSKITIYGLESIEVTREDDEAGTINLIINGADDTCIVIDCGRFFDDLSELRTSLENATEEAGSLIEGWEDRPDDEDGYVGFGRDSYYASLSQKACVAPYASPRDGFLTRDIATYHLAEAMAESGYFPNAWYEEERGGHTDISESVRAFHDEGGTSLKPLPGVTFEEDDEVMVDGEYATIVFDYGAELGIVYRAGDRLHHTDDRDDIVRIEDEDGDE